MARDFLSEIYFLDTDQQRHDLYSEWADSYDADLSTHGYVTPDRCAQAAARFVRDKSRPVLDVGCGTGISGKALASAGFSNISGMDVNREMLAKAMGLEIYRELSVAEPGASFQFEPGTYELIAAIGVIGTGAAPIDFLHECLSVLAPGNLMVFSFNDHTLAEPEYMNAVDDKVTSGDFRILHREHGPHISKLNMCSTVIVLQRT